MGDRIGVGSYAHIHKATNRETGEDVAVKLIDKERMKGVNDTEDQIYMELQSLTDLDQDGCAITLIDWFEDHRFYYLITDAFQMNLWQYMNRYCNKLTEQMVLDIFFRLVQAVLSCHNNMILHRDLKPENVLINADKNGIVTDLKLCDFGASCQVGIKSGMLHIGTLGYQPPEYLNGIENQHDHDHNDKFDVWSLGIVLYNLITGSMPFEGNPEQIRYKVMKKSPKFASKQWKLCSPHAKSLTKELL